MIPILYYIIINILSYLKQNFLGGGGGGVRQPQSQVTISHSPNETSHNMTNGPLFSATDMWEKVSFLLASDSQLPKASIKFTEVKTWDHTVIIRA